MEGTEDSRLLTRTGVVAGQWPVVGPIKKKKDGGQTAPGSPSVERAASC